MLNDWYAVHSPLSDWLTQLGVCKKSVKIDLFLWKMHFEQKNRLLLLMSLEVVELWKMLPAKEKTYVVGRWLIKVEWGVEGLWGFYVLRYRRQWSGWVCCSGLIGIGHIKAEFQPYLQSCAVLQSPFLYWKCFADCTAHHKLPIILFIAFMFPVWWDYLP